MLNFIFSLITHCISGAKRNPNLRAGKVQDSSNTVNCHGFGLLKL